MSEPLPWLIKGSVKIARDYLTRTGELENAAEADQFFLRTDARRVPQADARQPRDRRLPQDATDGAPPELLRNSHNPRERAVSRQAVRVRFVRSFVARAFAVGQTGAD